LFKICARTVLELGAELISSDVIAFYELIKNGFDAKSPNGVAIHFKIILRRNLYLKFRNKAIDASIDIKKIKMEIENAFETTSPIESRNRFYAHIKTANTHDELVIGLDKAYAKENKIIVSDRGSGMSIQDLQDNYLVIGTPSRKRSIDEASKSNDKAPYLGEKGIGRLSVMRLGGVLSVKTATENDEAINSLIIDWSDFNDIDAMLDEIDVEPTVAGEKPDKDWSGTRLIIQSLNADWTNERVMNICSNDFSRLTDPFKDSRERPRIAVFWNGNRIPISSMDKHLIDNAHATVKGTYRVGENGAELDCLFEAFNLGFEHPHEVDRRIIPLPDLEGAISGVTEKVSRTALTTLGAFDFELFWFNRRLFRGVDSIGDKRAVQALHKRWSGILLFRDGFRVLPYGEQEDDWLSLDQKALRSKGYLLNKSQFIGRVQIARINNPDLVDQTNREGLRVCPEQEAFIGLLQFVIQDHMRDFLVDIDKRYRSQPIDISQAKTDVVNLEKRAKQALRAIKRIAGPDESGILAELEQYIIEFKEFFDSAQFRIDEVENENRQMMQMAGVGLLVEVVAHELARSTENALAALSALKGEELPEDTMSLLKSLKSEMTSVSKRVRILDPLSVSGRQRKEVFNILELINEVISGHKAQFARHAVEIKVIKPTQRVRIKAVKGMIIQILENLISNSLYWLELRGNHEQDFKPRITISFDSDPLTIIYEDNGRGITIENREKVFRPFFSLKEKSKRRGLGLLIARDCMEHHNGVMILDEEVNQDTGRLHKFIMEFPSETEVK